MPDAWAVVRGLVAIAVFSFICTVSGQCPGPVNTYLPHESQCDRYYACINGTLTEDICPDGLAFNDRAPPFQLRCDQLADVDCSLRPQLQPAQPTDHCPRQWGIYPHEADCTRFYKCVHGRAFEFPCPEGLAYNPDRSYCDWPDVVDGCDSEAIVGFQCPAPTPEETEIFGNTLQYAHFADCRKHFSCVDSYAQNRRVPRLHTCEDGQVFNPIIRACDDAVNVPGCENYYAPGLRANGRRLQIL